MESSLSNGYGRNSCTNKPANSNYSGSATSNACPWSCNPGYYGSSANGNTSCAACGSGNFCTGGTHRAACSTTIKSGSPTPTGIVSLSSGSWDDYEHGASSADCICSWHSSDTSTALYLQQTQCYNGPTGTKYRYYSQCRTGYYATDALGWGNWYSSCTACNNGPSHSYYTGYSTPSTMYAEESNCPWGCEAGYYVSGSSCAACTSAKNTTSTTSGTESCTRSCSITNGTGTATGSRSYTNTCSGYYTTGAQGTNGVSQCLGCSEYGTRTSTGTCSGGTCYVATCNTDFYKTGDSTCGAVGTGYYSANGSTSRSACSNKPSNSTYTGSGGGANNCPWKCDAGYYKSGSSCVKCEAGYGCPGDDNRYECTGTTYSDAGASRCTSCPNSATGYWSWNGNSLHDSVYECYKKVSYTGTYGSGTRNCYYTSGSGTSAVYNGNSNAGCDSYSFTSCKAGYYYTSGTDCSDVGSGYFSGEGSTSRSTCPNGYSGSDGSRAANTNCYVSCSAKTISNGTTTPVNSKEYYNGSTYPACTFNVNCNSKYGASGNKTTSPACTLCNTGYYSAGGTNACATCSNKPANSSYVGNASSNSCPWSCNSGYNQTADNQCGQFCGAGITHIKLGNGLSIPLYSSARTSPAINVKWNNSICYGSLVTGNASGALNVKVGSTTYHSTN